MKKLISMFRRVLNSIFVDDSRQDVRAIIREEVTEALRELLSNPSTTFQLVRPSLTGTAFPFVSGSCTTSPGDINAGNFNCGAYVFLATSAGTTPLAVKAAASQTADLQQWQDSSGNVLAAVGPSGKVGIGTDSPDALLHVAKDSTYTVDSSAALTVSNATTPAMRLMFGYDSSLGKAYIQATQEGVDVQPLLFNPLGGSVGLGTTSPQATMHVAQDSAYTSNTAAGLIVSNRTTPAKRMEFGYDANIDAGYIQSTQALVGLKPLVMNPAGGNVGVGTVAPQKQLTLGPGIFAVEVATPAAPTLMAVGSGSLSGTYYYRVAALDGLGGETAASAEVSITFSGKDHIAVSWTAVAGAASYRVYRGTSGAGSESKYFSVIGTTTSYNDNGTGGTTENPKSVTTAYLSATGDATVILPVSEAVVRTVSRITPGFPLSGDTANAGLYIKVDLQDQMTQIAGIQGDLLNQQDRYGAFCSVNHYGRGDCFHVALLLPPSGSDLGANVAFESASYVDSSADFGSRGIISTIQTDDPNPANTLFNALWGHRTNPTYGMYFADQSPANALLIAKYAPSEGESPLSDSDPQLSLWESDFSRDRFAAMNGGDVRLSSLAATSGTQTADSPNLVLRGAYWNGSASADLDWKIRNDVTGASASRLAITEPGGTDRIAVVDSGDLIVLTAGKGIIFKSPDGLTCRKLTIDNSGNAVWTTVTCP